MAEKARRYLGLDLGEKRIGVALSDPLGMMAFPHSVLLRQGEAEAIAAIARLVEKEGVGRVVVGLPRSLNGSIGPAAQGTQAFAQALSQAIPVPVETYDERFTTVAAEARLREAGVGPRKRKQHRDALAAALLLQSYLDSLKSAS